jgi:hypothetical protein
MKMSLPLVLIVCLLVCSQAAGLEKKAYQLREDFGTAPLFDCALQYYYYVPCPTYSWFFAYSGFEVGDVIGQWFEIGDLSTGGFGLCDPVQCHALEQIRVLDFSGYGSPSLYPAFPIELDAYCCDIYGCPVGPSLWNSGPVQTGYAWNYIPVDPPLSLCPCATDPGPPASAPRILITATHLSCPGQCEGSPEWGFDAISLVLEEGCVLHDYGCLPVLYPRPQVGHHTAIHSGYYGQGLEYCPPFVFLDANDTTLDGSQYGFVELCWRIYIVCSGSSKTGTTTWSNIKSMYE